MCLKCGGGMGMGWVCVLHPPRQQPLLLVDLSTFPQPEKDCTHMNVGTSFIV